MAEVVNSVVFGPGRIRGGLIEGSLIYLKGEQDQVNMQGWFDGYILKPFTVEGLLDFVAVFKGRTK